MDPGRRAFSLAGLAASAAAAGPLAHAAHSDAPKLRVGIVRFAGEAHQYVALAHGLFAREGLHLTVSEYDSGAKALAGLFAGEVDVATAATIPVVYAAMRAASGEAGAPPPIRILANLLRSSQMNNIVINGDRGITEPAHLHGRTIGLTGGTSSEYFWDTFARARGIDTRKVRTVDAGPGELAAGFRAGRFDAVVAWEPIVSDLRADAKFPVVVLPAPEIYLAAWMVVVRAADLPALADRLQRYLRALFEAERRIDREPAAAAAAHAARIGLPVDRLAGIYRIVSFDMGLAESLVRNLELQAAWATRKGRAGGVPDFRALMDGRLLERIKPESVQLLG